MFRKIVYFILILMLSINTISFTSQNITTKTQHQSTSKNETPTISTTINFNKKNYKNNKQILSLIDLYNSKIFDTNLEEYTGKIEHLYFNTLIAFPNKAFDSKNNYNCIYDQEKITANEFKKILNELYLNNYILINPNTLFTNTQSKLIKNKLYLPQNKKPIILSFDNVTYKSNYQNLGEIDKIIIDRNNNIATYTTKQSIQDRINYENEFIVILENFINIHPDFSFNNSRGIIFFTGENGLLGYNTTHKNASNKSERKKASQVIKKLSTLGWTFGCNNYRYIDSTTINDFDFANDISLWNKEIKPLINNTNFFAYPYGNFDKENIFKQDLLKANGFNIFFYTNNTSANLDVYNDICLMSRRAVNGETLRSNELSHLFDCNKVYDHSFRPIPFSS